MDDRTFAKFREIVYEKSGITLSDKKQYLVSARVSKRMRTLGINDYRKYLKHVMECKSGNEVVQLLDVISTNVTSFFRESEHFDFLEKLIRQWLEAGQRRFRLWCSACSSGEETYSIAMSLLEASAGFKADMKILGTDISTRVLNACREARYPEKKTATIPPKYLKRYCIKENGQVPPHYLIKDRLKQMIVFKRLNLSAPPFPMKGPLDVVFCRNVMIYFDNAVRKRLLEEIYRLLKPGGYLMVGHAESLTGMVSNFKSIRPSIYIKE